MEIIKVITDPIRVPENFTGIVEFPNGTRYWFKNGAWHREDGPAVLFYAGTEYFVKYWYLNGIQVSPMEVFERMTPEQKEKVIWDLDEWK